MVCICLFEHFTLAQRSVSFSNGKQTGFVSFFPDENVAFPAPCYAGGGVRPNDSKSLSFFPVIGFTYTLSFTGFAYLQGGTFSGWGNISTTSGSFYFAQALGIDTTVANQGWQIMGGPNRVKTPYQDLVYLGISTTCDAPHVAELDLSNNGFFFITVKNNSTANLALNIQLGDNDSLSTNCDNCAFVINSVNQGSFQTYTANFSGKWGCQYGKCSNNVNNLFADSTHITGILITPNGGDTISGEAIDFSILNIGVGKPTVSLTFPDFKKSFSSWEFVNSTNGGSTLWPFKVGTALSHSPTFVSVTAPGFSLSLTTNSGFASNSVTLNPDSNGILAPQQLYLLFNPLSSTGSILTNVTITQNDIGTLTYPVQVIKTGIESNNFYTDFFSLKNQPVGDEIVLIGNEHLVVANLISPLGSRENLQFTVYNDQIQIPIPQVKSGWYILELITLKGTQMKKIIKL